MDLEILKQRAQAFDYLFDAVVVTNLQGQIIDWNKGSESLYGYCKAEALGQAVNILHVPEDSERITTEVISAVQAHGKWSGEIRMLRKNGDIGWVESMCVPIFDDNQQMIGALGINRDITSRINETERLKHLAHFDQLTNVPNRYLLLDRVEHLITQSKRNQHQFALLFIDVDNFKQINDSNGHLFGDQVLVEIALRLKKSIRDSDTVARFGGDEFVILLENIAHKQGADMITESLSHTLNSQFTIDSITIDVRCSIGVAIYPAQGMTTDALIASADKAMYKNK